MNPGITLDQFALAVELEDNYQTDSYDLEYPGLIMTIRLNTVTITVDHHHFNCDHDLEQLTIWLKKDAHNMKWPWLTFTSSLTRDAGFHLLQTYLQQFGDGLCILQNIKTYFC